MKPESLKTSSLRDSPPMQASKWLKHQFLIDLDEMKELLKELGSFYIFLIGGKYRNGEENIPPQAFLECYRHYVDALKEGRIPDEENYKKCFSSVFTVTSEALRIIPIDDQHHLLRLVHPVIQIQTHQMDYSPIDGKFRSMVLGYNNILWGLQASYPQIFQNPANHAIEKVIESSEFPNTTLYKRLQVWLRRNTVPTPVIVDNKKTNLPVRIGKKCFSWIQNHPQLKEKGIGIG